MDGVESEEEYQQFYDRREARLKELGSVIDQWQPKDNDLAERNVEDHYAEVGRLRSLLEETRRRVESVKRTRDDWKTIRDDIDQAIAELERAIAEAGPRFQ